MHIADDVPIIDNDEAFTSVVTKLTAYISKAIDAAYTYEQLRTSFAGQSLRPLITYLSDDCHHPAIVAALLASRYAFGEAETDGAGINDSRALACELVAWQFLTFLSERELMEYLLYELPKVDKDASPTTTRTTRTENYNSMPRTPLTSANNFEESTPLLQSERPTQYDGLVGPLRDGPQDRSITESGNLTGLSVDEGDDDELATTLAGMNALEIALICNGKKFISCRPVQRVVTDVWSGDIVFWESLSVHSVKKPVVYKKRSADPFLRLRVRCLAFPRHPI